MELEKMAIDGFTLFFRPLTINKLKNCIMYISESNYNLFFKLCADLEKREDVEPRYIKTRLKQLNDFLEFSKKNIDVIDENVLQTEPLLFNPTNNSYIVVVKDVKDLRDLGILSYTTMLNKYINDTIFISIYENSMLYTADIHTVNIVEKNNLEIYVMDISDYYDE